MRKITEQEINQIFNFTKKHYVEHYDVQVELVDHLANAIENQWKQNSNISFDDALQMEFKKFGVFGFTGLVEQKQAELHKFYNKMLWNEVLKFISIPKVIITIALYLAIYFFVKNTGSLGELIALAFLLISFLFFMVDGLRYIYKIKKDQKKQGKSWLIQSVAQAVFSLPTIGLTGGYFSIVSRLFEDNLGISNAGIHFLTAFIVFQTICVFVFYKIIKPSLNNSIQETENRFQVI